MCGIIFTLNAKGANPVYADDFLRDAFLASQVRGTDGAGLFQVTADDEVSWHKAGRNASEFVTYEQSKKEFLAANRCPITVGHVRAATSGGTSTDNSHPFCIEREDGTSIIGVHNGTIPYWKSKEDAEKFKVDSEWVFHMIAKYGIEAFKKIDGAFALVWYDSRSPGKIFMTRNKERPLHYMLSSDNTSMYGASEVGMLGWVTQRNHIFPKSGETCFYLEDDKVYAFDLTGTTLGRFETVKRPKYEWTGYSSAATTTTSENAGRSVYTRNNRDDRSGDMFEDDIPWGAGYGYGYSGYYNIDDESDQECTLNGVREALLQASRAERAIVEGDCEVIDIDTQPEIVVDKDALDRAMHLAITKQLSDREPEAVVVDKPFRGEGQRDLISQGQLYLTSARGSSASRGEIKAAKEAGLFGLVVRFNGYEYDDDTNTCIGTATVVVDGKRTDTDGEIRYIPQKVADDIYVSRGSDLAVLVGLRLTENWAVFEMLDMTQRLHVARMLDAEAGYSVN